MANVDRAEWSTLSGAILDATDSEIVYQAAIRQGFVGDKYDSADGVTVITARTQVNTLLTTMTATQNRMIRGLLLQLDDIGVDTFAKKGGVDGIDFSPVRDANSVERDICQILVDRPTPVTGGGPFFA